MSKRRHTDDQIFAQCESMRKSGQSVTIRNVYAILKGNWPRVARLVTAFNKEHDALAVITRAHDQAILENQELAIENGKLNIRVNELTHLVEEYKMKLIESDRNATLMLQAAMEETRDESAMHAGGSQ
jgi:hypothetical protein